MNEYFELELEFDIEFELEYRLARVTITETLIFRFFTISISLEIKEVLNKYFLYLKIHKKNIYV